MTQVQINRSVARRTGEALCTVRSRGFQFQPGPSLDWEPDVPRLTVACPHCGRPCALPLGRRGPATMGECVPCDVFFDYRPAAVRVAD